MNAADGVMPDGRCRWCNALVDRLDAREVERDVHHLTGWVHVRGILYQLVPCGCVYSFDPDAGLELVDLVDEPAPPAVRLPGRHRPPAPPRRARWPGIARRAV